MLSTFSGIVGEVINAIEDLMSSVADIASIEHAIAIVGLQEAKESRKHAVGMRSGNMFAKMIDLGDNFSSFDEFLNKYIAFVDGMEDLGIELMPSEEVFLNVNLCS